MFQKNIINRLVFDIRFDSETDTFGREESLESFTCKRLMPVVDEVLEHHSANGSLIRIDSLKIDLGDLSYGDFREKMPERLKERLSAAIREKIRSLKGSNSSQEGVFSRQEANYRLIEHFLSTGTLPWETDLKTDLSFSRLLQDVLSSNGRRLADFLKRAGANARKRLVRQFSAQDLIALVHLLAPDHYQFVIDTVTAIDRVQRKKAFIPAGEGKATLLTWDLVFEYLLNREGERFSPDGFVAHVISGLALATGTNTIRLLRDLSTASLEVDVASKSLAGSALIADNERVRPPDCSVPKKQIWEFALTYLLVDRGSQFDEKTFTRSVIEQITIHYHRPYSQLLLSLREAIEAAQPPEPIKKRAITILTELEGKLQAEEQNSKATAPESQKIAPETQDVPRSGQSRIDLNGEAEKELLNYLNQDRPVSADKKTQLIRALIADDERVSSHDRSVPKKQIWEFALTYLLVDRESQFDEMAFTRSVIEQIAIHWHWPYSQLLLSLKEAIEAAQPLEPIKKRAIAILTELEGKLKAEEQNSKATALENQKISPETQDVPRSGQSRIDLNDLNGEAEKELLNYLNEDRPVSAGKKTQLIRALIVDDERMSSTDRSVPKKQIWEFALTYLLVDRGSQFDEKAFIRSVIEQIAIHRNWPYSQLLLSLREAIEAAQPPEPIKKRAITILTELEGKLQAEEQNSKATAPENQKISPEAQDVPRSGQSRIDLNGEAEKELAPGPEHVAQGIELSDITKGLEEDHEFTKEIYIANAGLVLAAPYLPRLFSILELTEEAVFKDRKAAERAVHLLQFMVNESTASPEYQLVLNKILCGVRTGIPITRQIEISTKEKETIEGLIRGMIRKWKIIGKVSVQGLRESFLQREGRLGLKDDTWQLLVEQRAFDMLLDQVPWSFSIIKHPWMERVVYVEWR